MADYIYLLETRLSTAQRDAMRAIREMAVQQGVNLFLVGGAVRDLTSGSPVRDLDFAVQGDALVLENELTRLGARVEGVQQERHTVAFSMPAGVRAELGSTLTASYPQLGKPVFTPATLLEDLRRRDFTANAMALSLNEGSYGLLIDPLNGTADIENRELRLVSNYGFLEEPVRLVRAARLMARLGWALERRTRDRYENAAADGGLELLTDYHRGYELEQIVREEDPVRVLSRLEAEGWLKELAPAWHASQVDAEALERLRDAQTRLSAQGIMADSGAVAFPLLTARLRAGERTALKAQFPHKAFADDIEGLGAAAQDLATKLLSRAHSSPSAAWRLLHSARPEAVLQLLFVEKSNAVQMRLRDFLNEWPKARQRLPLTLMQEMRINPGIEGYDALVAMLVDALMDGQLATAEEMRAFLEPYSPPAPVVIQAVRRPRTTSRKEGKAGKSRPKKLKSEADLPIDSPAEEAEDDEESDTPDFAARSSDLQPASDVSEQLAEAKTTPDAVEQDPLSSEHERHAASSRVVMQAPQAAPRKRKGTETTRPPDTPPAEPEQETIQRASKPQEPKPASSVQTKQLEIKKASVASAGSKPRVVRPAVASSQELEVGERFEVPAKEVEGKETASNPQAVLANKPHVVKGETLGEDHSGGSRGKSSSKAAPARRAVPASSAEPDSSKPTDRKAQPVVKPVPSPKAKTAS